MSVNGIVRFHCSVGTKASGPTIQVLSFYLMTLDYIVRSFNKKMFMHQLLSKTFVFFACVMRIMILVYK